MAPSIRPRDDAAPPGANGPYRRRDVTPRSDLGIVIRVVLADRLYAVRRALTCASVVQW